MLKLSTYCRYYTFTYYDLNHRNFLLDNIVEFESQYSEFGIYVILYEKNIDNEIEMLKKCLFLKNNFRKNLIDFYEANKKYLYFIHEHCKKEDGWLKKIYPYSILTFIVNLLTPLILFKKKVSKSILTDINKYLDFIISSFYNNPIDITYIFLNKNNIQYPKTNLDNDIYLFNLTANLILFDLYNKFKHNIPLRILPYWDYIYFKNKLQPILQKILNNYPALEQDLSTLEPYKRYEIDTLFHMAINDGNDFLPDV